MERKTYVSCIKINGIPILPPIMSNNVREEMSHYKQLAIAVEEKLKVFHDTKQTNNSQKSFYNTDEESVNTDSESITLDSVSNMDSSSNATTITKSPFTKNMEGVFFEDDAKLKTKKDIDYAMSETYKPEVPKTLNITPMVLDDLNQEKSKTCFLLNENMSKSREDIPKLIRQNSYVLETPSPMLLAHIQTELGTANQVPTITDANYIPTPTTNTVRRKEWNILQAKSEWQNQIKNQNFIVSDSAKAWTDVKCRRNSICNVEQRTSKSICRQINSEFPCTTYHSTRSVDCIQSILAKEYICKSNGKTNVCNHKYKTSNGNEVNFDDFNEKWRKNQSVSILNMANKLGGSLNNLDNRSLHSHKSIGARQEKEILMNQSFDENILRNSDAEDFVHKTEALLTPIKLLTVFKEIKEMHKKQMIELVARQHKEQTLLQEEFEKQQLLLLTEIKKSFPETSRMFTESPDPLANEKLVNEKENINNELSTSKQYAEVENKDDSCAIRVQNSTKEETVCPLDYIYPRCENNVETCRFKYNPITERVGRTDVSPLEVDGFASTREHIQSDVSASVCNIDHSSGKNDKASCCYANRHKNVNRRLFPLDGKTVHVPILDSLMYTEKHIRAANVINTYARGYLVRRIMRTERVITLKNTYKEALRCLLKLHVDAPLTLPECDAASMNIVELFAQSPAKRMQIIAHDREIKRSRIERPTSARSYSFATQRTLARKKRKEMREYQPAVVPIRSYSSRSRCQTWTSDVGEKLISPNVLHQSIKRSTSAGTVRKPWR